MREKRNSTGEIDQGDLFGGWPGAPGGGGVGARQTHQAGVGRGGGYLKNCGSPNFPFSDGDRDPRLDELREIGLPRAWLAVADRIGFDAWMDVWRILSADPARDRCEGGLKMPKLRDYDSYLRFQRNRYIQALALQGMPAQEVRKMVEKNLGELLTEKHVEKLVRGALRCMHER